MAKEDVKRYIELEAPSIGVVENDVSELVCFNDGCQERVEVDPATLVPEQDRAVDVESKIAGSDRYRCEVYCSPECRNETYSN